MDLFSDLPVAACTTLQNVKEENIKVPQTGNKDRFDLFGSLPDTSQTECSASNKSTSDSLKRKLSPQEDSHILTKKSTLDLCELKGYFAERKGEREEMQDAHVILEHFTTHVDHLDSTIRRLGYFAVFDGHAGCRASKHSATQLHRTLAAKFPRGDVTKVEEQIKRCFVETYKKTDEDFLKQASKSKPSWKDGTTATTALVINNTLYIANLADSKAILCRQSEKKVQAITLTKDHSPQDFTERMRIQKAGGQVKDGRLMGVLEVSRSIGDGPYKNHGLTCVPDIKRCQLTQNDKWILIACDGLWKTFTNVSVVEFVNQILQDESIQAADQKSAEEVRWETAAKRLASEAVRRLSADNVTVILIKLIHTL